MSRSNHSEAQMIGALKELEAWRKAEDGVQVTPSRLTPEMEQNKFVVFLRAETGR